MGHVTRHEVGNLIQRFKERVIPPSTAIGSGDLHYMGINAVQVELEKESGPSSVLLRNYARVLKHYNDLPKDPKNIVYANAALAMVSNGFDATHAIKKARLVSDKPKVTDLSQKLRPSRADRMADSLEG